MPSFGQSGGGGDSWLRSSLEVSLDKKHVARLVNQRVHQPMFRTRVLSAYGRKRAVCTLKYPELLDAARIISDSDERDLPW